MSRIKGGMNKRKRHTKILKQAKGYYGAKSKQFRTAKEAVMKSMAYAFSGRKQKKRDYRSLWIVRINAASREAGLSYSQFMSGLNHAGIEVNRKMLADMAVNDIVGFNALVDTAKQALEKVSK